MELGLDKIPFGGSKCNNREEEERIERLDRAYRSEEHKLLYEAGHTFN